MTSDVRVLRGTDLEALADGWDALPARRGAQADFYDSWAWFASWWHNAGSQAAARVRVPAVLQDDGPVSLLPMVARSSRRWESAGSELRTRYRPVLGSEHPDADLLDPLVDAAARAGARELVLHRLPARDPATPALVAALRRAGFTVHQRERSSDCLAVVEGGWPEHRRRFASYDRAVRTKLKRLRGLWEVTVEEYGPATGRPIADGFSVYADIQARSWKGRLSGHIRAQRLELLTRSEAVGWGRLYILSVAGVPTAGHVWFRFGDVATWLSTAYDQRMAALSPGSIIMWQAQELLFAESAPRLVDFLPGRNPQKDELGPDRAPLLIVEAARTSPVSGITFPVRREIRRVAPAVAGRVRARLATRSRNGAPLATHVRRTEVPPADSTMAAAELPIDPRVKRYLAVAAGHASPEKMVEGWAADDSWWQVGEGPAALVRLGSEASSPRVVREVVLGESWSGSLEDILGAVATATGAGVCASLPDAGGDREGAATPVHRAPLPWPAGQP